MINFTVYKGGGVVSHHDYIKPKEINDSKVKELLEKFLEENSNMPDWRMGAKITTQFGIAEGWGPKWEDGYIRIHQGIDRARGGTYRTKTSAISDIVICPFNFNRTKWYEYIDKKGNPYSFGTLVVLYADEYDFCMRIAHFYPDKIIQWSKNEFKKEHPFKQGWLIGPAGSYGYSTGNHTHDELVSLDESTEIFEELLYQKYGDEVFKGYTDEEIIQYYRFMAETYPKTSPWVNASDKDILRDWAEQLSTKKVYFINKYKAIFSWDGKTRHTRYSSEKLFG